MFAINQQHPAAQRALCRQRQAGQEGAPVKRGLVDAAHLVEHKQAGQQHRQREDLGAVLARLRSGGGGQQGMRSWAAAARAAVPEEGRLPLAALNRSGPRHGALP